MKVRPQFTGLKQEDLWRTIMPVTKSQRVAETSLRELAERTVGERLYIGFPYADSRMLEEKSGSAITAVISTNDVDHYQTIIEPRGGIFSDYVKNPVVLYQHGYDYRYGSWVVGNCSELRRGDATIEADTVFDLNSKENKLGLDLDRMYRAKIMRGWSIGFMPITYDVVKVDDVYLLKYLEWRMFEYSAVAVPGNQNALTKGVQVESEALREYIDLIVRENRGDKTTTIVSVPKVVGRLERIPTNWEPAKPEVDDGDPPNEQRQAAAKPGKPAKKESRYSLDSAAVLKAAGLEVRDGMKIEICMEDATLDDAALGRLNKFLAGMKGRGEDGTDEDPDVIPIDDESEEDDDEERLLAELEEEARGYDVEWEEPYVLANECEAAGESTEILERMAAVVIGRGEERRAVLMHHHADGRVSWRALIDAMARLLTEPLNMTDDERLEAYRHLAAHYRACGVEPPEAGRMSEDDAYDEALAGRLAWRVNRYGYIFVEPAMREGKLYGAGFRRIDDVDGTAVKTGPIPELGRFTNHRQWGKRTTSTRSIDETGLSQIAELRRELEGTLAALREGRAGAEFSKKNKRLISEAADAIDSAVTEQQRALEALRSTGTMLRSLVEKVEETAADETKGIGDSHDASVSGPGSSASDAPRNEQRTPAKGTGGRRLTPR